MEKITYREIVEFIKAVDGVKGLRRIYWQGSTVESVFVDGPQGLFTNLNSIFNFYNRHLIGINTIDTLFNRISEEISMISKEDIENGLFPKLKYKEQILKISDYIENVDDESNNLFSIISIYKFYNFTFQSDTLLYNVHTMYPSEVWNFIPDSSKSDLIEGAKGLLVDIPTGSAFLFLRALEGCIRKVCKDINKVNESGFVSFGKSIKELEEFFEKIDLDKKNKDFVSRQLDLLKYIKNEYRNPAAHPEKSFIQYEAEQLFQVVNVAINRLYDLSKLVI